MDGRIPSDFACNYMLIIHWCIWSIWVRPSYRFQCTFGCAGLSGQFWYNFISRWVMVNIMDDIPVKDWTKITWISIAMINCHRWRSIIPRLNLSGWWFGTLYRCVNIFAIILPTDFHIFQRDWNHQPILGDVKQTKRGAQESRSRVGSMIRIYGSLFFVACWRTAYYESMKREHGRHGLSLVNFIATNSLHGNYPM